MGKETTANGILSIIRCFDCQSKKVFRLPTDSKNPMAALKSPEYVSYVQELTAHQKHQSYSLTVNGDAETEAKVVDDVASWKD